MGSRRSSRLIGIVLAAAVIGSCLWLAPDLFHSGKAATATPGALSRPTVAVVGDSITSLSRQSIATSLVEAGYQPTIDAVVGIEMAQAEPFVYELAQQRPHDWIIELGTNDAGRDNQSWSLPFLTEWREVRSSACVIYLSVSTKAGSIAIQVNNVLAGLANTHDNVHLLDWGELEYGNPGWMEPDMIHPTPAGQAELAALETQEVRRYC